MGRLGVSRVARGSSIQPSRLCLAILLAALPLPCQSPGSEAGSKAPAASRPSGEQPSAEKTATSFSGILQGVVGTSLILETTGSKTVIFRFTTSTKFLRQDKEARPSDFQKGEFLDVEARPAEGGRFVALNVRLGSPPPARVGEGPAPSRQVDGGAPPARTAPAPPREGSPPNSRPGGFGEDPGPPVLRRNEPNESKDTRKSKSLNSKGSPAPYVSSDPAPREDPFLETVHEATERFTSNLPNFICRQLTTRYWSETAGRLWEPMDVVQADLILENGRESYRNLRINNRPVKEGKEQRTGTWSTGEYSTALRHILERPTNAEFEFQGARYFAGAWVWIYDFRVAKERSRWLVAMESKSLYPEFQGSIWVDQKTSRVVRLEMQAINIPNRFPLDKVEMTVDYAGVRIGSGEYLLPVEAENLSCWRGRGRCSRNKIEFRNYRKFSSDSTIYHTDSEISFDRTNKPEGN